jgi:V8-like Glu-specific endopeptidase
MKILILLSLFFVTDSIKHKEIAYSNDEIKAENKFIAENSTTEITHHSKHKQSYGTGLFVKIKNQQFVLTNAHICLPNNLQALFYFFAMYLIQTEPLVEKQLYTMIMNHKRDSNNVEVYSGAFQKWNFSSDIQFAAADGSDIVVKHPRSQSYSFPTHQGDSGSPVFNANYELVGLIFANIIGVHYKEKKIYEYQAGLIILSKELIELAQQI